MESERKTGMLQTARLHLRNLCQADAGTLFDYRNNVGCSRFQRYEDTSMEYLQRFVEDYSHSTFLSREEEQHYAIVRNGTLEMTGDLSVFFSEADNCFTLGITIAPLFQKRGYAYEILKEAVAQIRDQYPFSDIVALIERENAGSIALFKKLGFAEECYADSIRSYVYTRYGKND